MEDKTNKDLRGFDNSLAKSNRNLFNVDAFEQNTDKNVSDQDLQNVNELFVKIVNLVTHYLINVNKNYSNNDINYIIGICEEINGAVTDYSSGNLDYDDLKDLVDGYELDLSKIKQIDPNRSWLFESFLGSWQSVAFCIVLIISFIVFFN